MEGIVNAKKIALFLSICSLPAIAAENGFYTQANLGYAAGVAPGGNFEQNTLGNSAVYGASLGYRFDEHLRADFGIDFRNGFENQFSVEEETQNKRGNQVTYTDTQTTKVKSVSAMFNVYYDIATINKITPYAMLGAGVARNQTTSNTGVFSAYSDGSPNSHYSFSNGTHCNFAWKLGAGAQYQLNTKASVDLHYQYVNLGKFRTGNIMTTGSGRKFVHPNLEGKIQSHEVVLGLAYKL
jgi:opacity protein-like surface antigen